MTPYSELAEAAKGPPERGMLEEWNDFSCWESARGFGDDPNSKSKDAIAWIRRLDELACELDQFSGPAVEECRHALDAAAAAFARIDHEPQLCSAIHLWREFRAEEQHAKG